jgi:adenylyltransferase/sulfurtransferase
MNKKGFYKKRNPNPVHSVNKELVFNKNWYIFQNKRSYSLFNVASFTTLKIKFKNSLYRRMFEEILDNVQRKHYLSFTTIAKKFKGFHKTILRKIYDEILGNLKIRRVIYEKFDDEFYSRLFPSDYLLGLERQIDCFSDLFPHFNPYLVQKNLYEKKVAVLGLGIVAQYVILPLIASGIGNFIIVDFDKVEKRNIGRHPMLTKNDLGKFKTDVIKRYIENSRAGLEVKKFNIMIKGVEDAKEVIKESDLVVQACDFPRFEIRRWISKACFDLKKPNISVYSGKIGPLNIPNKTSCFGCYECFLNKKYPFYFELTKRMKEEGMRRYPEIPVVPIITGVLASKEIISYFLGLRPETINGFLVVDNNTLTIARIELNKQQNCYICGKKKKK